ncbi:hypothetical protein CEXT_364681 [Caerostris extrusa]|uniref:Uncharacterized protein n=1 Tax=Caerostris extrusa TaxID=172846 RepID=A0AAV4VCH5_CAEEX|nr:hypothetical protein CEXT_364681 [Caerostris extrusa]
MKDSKCSWLSKLKNKEKFFIVTQINSKTMCETPPNVGPIRQSHAMVGGDDWKSQVTWTRIYVGQRRYAGSNEIVIQASPFSLCPGTRLFSPTHNLP